MLFQGKWLILFADAVKNIMLLKCQTQYYIPVQKSCIQKEILDTLQIMLSAVQLCIHPIIDEDMKFESLSPPHLFHSYPSEFLAHVQ